MKKLISALLLSVVLCLGMLSTSVFAADVATGKVGGTTITVTAQANTLCALWGDAEFKELLLLFYTDGDGKATITVNEALKAGDTYYVGVQGQTDTAQKVAITSNNGGGGGSSGGGGGGSAKADTVSVASANGGKVTASPSDAESGDKVTLTIVPDAGYELDDITVTDSNGNEVKLTKISDTKYSFIMPDGKVTVKPVFVKIASVPATGFTDVAAGAWYADYVKYVVDKGIMNGYDDGRFGPNDKTTRAQIITVLYRLDGEPAAGTAAFSDVPANQYYTKAVAWGSANGVVKGYTDTQFAPNENVTREQIAAILYRYAAFKNYDVTKTASLEAFSDIAKVSEWSAEAMAWCVAEGLINGDNGALRPQGNATRAEIAAMLMRFCENVAK